MIDSLAKSKDSSPNPICNDSVMKDSFLQAATNEIKRFSNKDSSTGRYRTEFMRDRDRILYSKPFRRLSRKTQIFLPASDDHVRTRLTHSLEVMQISAVSAQMLGLDRDLTEAIALGHDIGHTPFGHTGERVLNLFLTNCDPLGGLSIKLEEGETGFKHNLQGLRQVIDLTDLYDEVRGLNLTNFTLWGIRNHTGTAWRKCDFRYQNRNGTFYCNYPHTDEKNKCIETGELRLKNDFYSQYDTFLLQKNNDNEAWSFEGLLVSIADEISQRHHDIEDGLIAGVIHNDEIIELIEELLFPYFDQDEQKLFSTLGKQSDIFVQKVSKLVVGCLNRNLITNSMENFKSFCKDLNINNRNEFERLYPKLSPDFKFKGTNGDISIREVISYQAGLKEDEKILKGELGKRVLNSYQVQRMDGKARFVIRQLAKAYLSNPQQLPDNMISRLIYLCHPERNEAKTIPISGMRAWLKDVYLSSQNNFIKRTLLRLIGDFIAGMTDDFALMEHAKLYSTSETFNLRHY